MKKLILAWVMILTVPTLSPAVSITVTFDVGPLGIDLALPTGTNTVSLAGTTVGSFTFSNLSSTQLAQINGIEGATGAADSLTFSNAILRNTATTTQTILIDFKGTFNAVPNNATQFFGLSAAGGFYNNTSLISPTASPDSMTLTGTGGFNNCPGVNCVSGSIGTISYTVGNLGQTNNKFAPPNPAQVTTSLVCPSSNPAACSTGSVTTFIDLQLSVTLAAGDAMVLSNSITSPACSQVTYSGWNNNSYDNSYGTNCQNVINTFLTTLAALERANPPPDNIAAVPEPSALILLGAGLGGLALFNRKFFSK